MVPARDQSTVGTNGYEPGISPPVILGDGTRLVTIVHRVGPSGIFVRKRPRDPKGYLFPELWG